MSVSKPLEDIILNSDPAHAMIFLGDQKTGKIMILGLNWGHGKGNVAKDSLFVIRSKLIKESIYSQIRVLIQERA